MYHISNDKRAKESSELIWKGLLKCLENKNFDNITISDLQRVTGVARSTFYRCFDNISDILSWKCDKCFFESLNYYDFNKKLNESHLAEHYFKYWTRNSEILELLTEINRQDIIYSSHLKNAELLKEKYGELNNLNDKNSRYFMAIRTSLTISILTTWLQGGKQETEEELIQIIKGQLQLINNLVQYK